MGRRGVAGCGTRAPGRRALYASIPQAGPLLGFLLSSAVIVPTLEIAGKDGFAEWAWRIPFLLSTALIVLGLWVRSRIAESQPHWVSPGRR